MAASPCPEALVSLLKGGLGYIMILCTSSVVFLSHRAVSSSFIWSSGDSYLPVKKNSSWSVAKLGNDYRGYTCRVLSLLPLGCLTCSSMQEDWLAFIAKCLLVGNLLFSPQGEVLPSCGTLTLQLLTFFQCSDFSVSLYPNRPEGPLKAVRVQV